ncbi:hypothetical protein CCU68_02850 [Pseudomonas gingeri NCPPB 3146 = LMG 5327]|uniref:SUMF1/EgtB/PvdO family nonheme iron enzyme n=2 Tax=Pseudomonas gingeri TaxID=117681 RepID=A0A7Y8CG43_9PSED|nr:SUMF1/EgtB/PvdO family nonheme iron enzyme [Pseudomonas gingeri]NWC17830.1 SUMF1/EgtB/PvdO family nonheme iron enzyme [Pseudomonas gingeri]PNQ94126.1 hypothetical protein CCU68_02850 [Pseudomonas gingeri NCPPB 3146 = LMG 5327]
MFDSKRSRSHLYPSVVLLTLLLGACNQNSVVPSQSLSPKQVAAMAERIDQRYPEQPASERLVLLQHVVKAIDNMVFVEGGTFEMGDFGWIGEYDPENMCEWPCGVDRDELWFLVPNADSRPLHTVRLDSFYMAKYHTTIAEDDRFRRFTGLPIYGAEPRALERELGIDIAPRISNPKRFSPDLPARSKLWKEAKNYCLWLGELSGLSIDLPTEAQYEYAARSGGRYVVYATDNGSINEGRNIKKKSGIYPVGSFPPNPLGLYEMGDNAVSWVNDWYAADYYQNSPVDNPQGPETGTEKVRRGGSALWTSSASMTMRRLHDNPVQEEYFSTDSYRCSIQQSGPLK